MDKRKVYAAVIGGGASGMMCAIRAAERRPDKRIVVIEKADRVGKKLLVTGNGRCNLSNLNARPERYHGEGSAALTDILFKKYGVETVIGCFRSMGLMTRADGEGRLYPLSNSSNSVLDVLRRRMSELGIEELCGAEVRKTDKTERGFKLRAGENIIYAEKLVLACGGRADYAGRIVGGELAGSLGLSLAPPSPSLCPVRVKGELTRALKGVRVPARVSLIHSGSAVKSEDGEVQFADGALSGICVFDLSRDAREGDLIALDLLPEMSADELRGEISSRTRRNPMAQASEIFTGMFRKNIGMALLKSCGIRPSTLCKDISEKELNNLSNAVKDWRFTCAGGNDFGKAQVTAGGVRLSEIDPLSFECKRIKNLYIIGEALDVDGDCGGYNLQFAWASGMCAGDSL